LSAQVHKLGVNSFASVEQEMRVGQLVEIIEGRMRKFLEGMKRC